MEPQPFCGRQRKRNGRNNSQARCQAYTLTKEIQKFSRKGEKTPASPSDYAIPALHFLPPWCNSSPQLKQNFLLFLILWFQNHCSYLLSLCSQHQASSWKTTQSMYVKLPKLKLSGVNYLISVSLSLDSIVTGKKNHMYFSWSDIPTNLQLFFKLRSLSVKCSLRQKIL